MFQGCVARRLLLSSARWPGDICLCAHLDFLLVSMLLLMLFSSLVRARPRVSAPPPPPPPGVSWRCCLTMLDQVVYRSVAPASSPGNTAC